MNKQKWKKDFSLEIQHENAYNVYPNIGKKDTILQIRDGKCTQKQFWNIWKTNLFSCYENWAFIFNNPDSDDC